MAEKILDHQVLARTLETLKSKGKKVVLADGVFDLLRTGHARYLRAAKALGDVLVLALPSDASVRKSLDPGRPLLPLEDRLGILSAFEMVDWVTSYPEGDVSKLLADLKPDIYASQGKTKLSSGSFGGRTVELKESGDQESDQLIQEILRKYPDPSIKINE